MRRVACLGFILLVVLLAVHPSAAQEGIQVSVSRFGVVEAYYRPADARDLGVGWERIIFEWRAFQPNHPGEFNTSAVPDTWLFDAQQAGREVIGLLKNTPYWASGTDKLGSPPTGLDLPIDDPNNYWAAFVRQTVKYYGEKWNIHRWIIYNEPDLLPGEQPWYEFDGTAADYYQMVKVASLAAKSVDPAAQIHLAGMAWWGDVVAGRKPYLERLLDIAAQDPAAADNGYFFDVATVHVYFGTLNIWNMVLDVRSILTHYDLQAKPIWVDETNASPTLDPLGGFPNPAYPVTLEQQADYIIQAAALGLAAKVDRFAIYRLYDDNFVYGKTEPWGLIRLDGTRRPAFDAYRTVIQYFSGPQHALRHWSDHSSMVTLYDGQKTVYVMWAREADPVQFYVGVSGTATQISRDGTTLPLDVKTVPDADGSWYVLDAPGAVVDKAGKVVVEGSPLIVVASGPPQTVWIKWKDKQWWLR